MKSSSKNKRWGEVYEKIIKNQSRLIPSFFDTRNFLVLTWNFSRKEFNKYFYSNISVPIYSLLKKQGGIWITYDATPKSFMAQQEKALPNFNHHLNTITSRNTLGDRFEDFDQVEEFFGTIGFEIIEIHPFSEMKEELYSINVEKLVDEHIEQVLEHAIVIVMKIREE